MDLAPTIAAIRFGLGATPGQDPGGDPGQWLRQQLGRPDAGPPGSGVAEGFAALRLDREERPNNGNQRARAIFIAETEALLAHAVSTATPFCERLTWFWANHLTVSRRRGEVAPLAGDYVREAIRPHVTGRFTSMLLAAMRHPAMLLYLDNAQSAGPDSPFGKRRGRGLNENLARECLELHTVSPAAGYTQADVTQFASLLTGWSIERRQEPIGFRFRAALHEPGPKTVMGRSFPAGEEGAEQALRWLGDHPSTHRHLATKLVRHFVADAPPQGAVRQIEGVLRDTHGDLGAAAAALTRLPEAWEPLTKIRTPKDYIVAAMRAAPLPEGVRKPNLPGLVAGLGQPMFNAPFPIGWPDTAGDWAGPESLMRRIDWAYGFAGRAELADPMQLAAAALGPLLTATTSTQMARAGSRRDAITLLLASPEFNRR